MCLNETIQLPLHCGSHLWRHPVVEQHPIQVVVLMLEHARLEAVQGHLELLAVQVLRLDLDAGWPLCGRRKRARGML